jgi:hypothetical protein
MPLWVWILGGAALLFLGLLVLAIRAYPEDNSF